MGKPVQIRNKLVFTQEDKKKLEEIKTELTYFFEHKRDSNKK